MPGNLSSSELGVVAIVLLLILKETFKFLKDVVIPRLSGNNVEAAKIRQAALNDLTIKQIAASMEKQTLILQSLAFTVTNHDKEFHEFTKDFHDSVHEILKNKN